MVRGTCTDQLQRASRVKEQSRLVDDFIKEHASRGSSVKGQVFPIPAEALAAPVLLYDKDMREDWRVPPFFSPTALIFPTSCPFVMLI